MPTWDIPVDIVNGNHIISVSSSFTLTSIVLNSCNSYALLAEKIKNKRFESSMILILVITVKLSFTIPHIFGLNFQLKKLQTWENNKNKPYVKVAKDPHHCFGYKRINLNWEKFQLKSFTKLNLRTFQNESIALARISTRVWKWLDVGN